jgi:hypothetical protein
MFGAKCNFWNLTRIHPSPTNLVQKLARPKSKRAPFDQTPSDVVQDHRVHAGGRGRLD